MTELLSVQEVRPEPSSQVTEGSAKHILRGQDRATLKRIRWIAVDRVFRALLL